MKSSHWWYKCVGLVQNWSHILEQSPRDWRKTKHQCVGLRVFHAWWHIFCVWKTVRTTFWRIVVSQSREDCYKMWEHVMDSGFLSETYALCFFQVCDQKSENVHLSLLKIRWNARSRTCDHLIFLKQTWRRRKKVFYFFTCDLSDFWPF